MARMESQQKHTRDNMRVLATIENDDNYRNYSISVSRPTRRSNSTGTTPHSPHGISCCMTIPNGRS